MDSGLNIIQPHNKVYFPEQDRVLEINNAHSGLTASYEFIPFHPVCVTSTMVGTSIEELMMHNFPNKKSWECSRLCNFPQEVIIRLNYRSHMKYILLKSKINKFIQEADIFVGDGVYGNFNDTEYRKVSTAKYINHEGSTIKVDGIGNYLKIVFTKACMKSMENPFGQVSIGQLKIFGKKVNHLVYYDDIEANSEGQKNKENIDRILIDLGLPLNDPYFIVNNQNYEIAPVDEDTKITLKDLLDIIKRADGCNIKFMIY